jgi:hypothetical protein
MKLVQTYEFGTPWLFATKLIGWVVYHCHAESLACLMVDFVSGHVRAC